MPLFGIRKPSIVCIFAIKISDAPPLLEADRQERIRSRRMQHECTA